jgi:hypothetical protein
MPRPLAESLFRSGFRSEFGDGLSGPKPGKSTTSRTSEQPTTSIIAEDSIMAHKLSRAAIVAALAVTCLAWAETSHAQTYGVPGWTSPEPNYYAMPAGADGLTAALYPCPRPTPPLIGETNITYSPLSPHEFLYRHHQHYASFNGPHQVTRTSITYGHHPTLWPFHPSLTSSAPALRTPASSCRF